MYSCENCVFNQISKGCSAWLDCSQEEFYKICADETNVCPYHFTVESAKFYAKVRNGVFSTLGDPVDFGRKCAESFKNATSDLQKAVDKNIEMHDAE